MKGKKKRLYNGTTTSTKGGRPVNIPLRKAQTAQILKLRAKGKTWLSIAETVGIPIKTASDLYQNFWKNETADAKVACEEMRERQSNILQRSQSFALGLVLENEAIAGSDTAEDTALALAKIDNTAKLLGVVIKCSDSLTRLHGCNTPVEITVNAGTLTMDQFMGAAALHVKPKTE